MKKILFSTFIFLGYFVFAQAKLITEGNILPSEYNETIFFEIENNYIIIPIEIDGKKYRFLLDTGAANFVNSRTFQNLPEISDINVHDSNSKKAAMKVVGIPAFKLGNLNYQNFKFVEFDFSKNYIFNCLNFDGIFGSNSMKDSVVKIDYQNKKLTITNSIKNISTSAKAQNMKLIGAEKSPYFEIKLSGKDAVNENVLFDSGFRSLYLQSSRAYNIIKEKKVYENVVSSPAQLSVGILGLEPVSEKSIFTIPSLQLGKAQFLNLTTYFGSTDNSLLGVEILKYGNVILDFPNSKYYFEPFNTKIDLKEEYPFYKPIFDNQKVRVGMVINEKLRKIISVGDVIASIDGQKFDAINCDTVFKLKAGTKSLTVIHNNEEIAINLKDFQ